VFAIFQWASKSPITILDYNNKNLILKSYLIDVNIISVQKGEGGGKNFFIPKVHDYDVFRREKN